MEEGLHGGEGGPTRRRFLLEAAVHEGDQRGGQAGNRLAEARRPAVQMGLEEGGELLLRKGRPTGEKLPEEDSRRVDVGRRRGRPSLDDLRSHVERRAEDHASGGEGHGAIVPPGQAEVAHLHGARLVDEDVGRLHVPVEHARSVHRGESPADLLGPAQGRLEIGAPPLQKGFQALSPDPFHDEEGAVVVPARVEQADHVVVPDPLQNEGLLDEAAFLRLVFQGAGTDALQGDDAIEATVDGAPHGAHRPLARLLVQGVAPAHERNLAPRGQGRSRAGAELPPVEALRDLVAAARHGPLPSALSSIAHVPW